MTTPETPATPHRQGSTKAFHAVYLVAIGVAMVGWSYFLGYFTLTMFGY